MCFSFVRISDALRLGIFHQIRSFGSPTGCCYPLKRPVLSGDREFFSKGGINFRRAEVKLETGIEVFGAFCATQPRSLGSAMSRNPSAMRLKAKTVRNMANPGNMDSQGAFVS